MILLHRWQSAVDRGEPLRDYLDYFRRFVLPLCQTTSSPSSATSNEWDFRSPKTLALALAKAVARRPWRSCQRASRAAGPLRSLTFPSWASWANCAWSAYRN